MTLDDAVATFRRLQAEAEEGWPYGYAFEAVAKEAGEALAVIEAHVHRAADPHEEAKAVRARIELVEGFRAGVPTKRERARPPGGDNRQRAVGNRQREGA